MKPLPMPLRLAAGLVATAVEQAREFPRKVVELPVTAVSQAMQVSMRLQQRVTELAIKGDRALSTLRPAAESPEWARFDEDPDPRADPTADPDRESTVESTVDSPVNGMVSDLRSAVPDQAAPDQAAPAATEPADDPATGVAEVCPLPGYEDMTIAQLRARLRRLSLETLRDLLVWETEHQDRPPFVTMLSNRITTVTTE